MGSWQPPGGRVSKVWPGASFYARRSAGGRRAALSDQSSSLLVQARSPAALAAQPASSARRRPDPRPVARGPTAHALRAWGDPLLELPVLGLRYRRAAARHPADRLATAARRCPVA